MTVTQGSNSNTYQAPVHGLFNPSNTIDKGLFAQPYRGWSVAGYNGGSTSDGTALDESKLVYKQSDYPTTSNYYNQDLGIDPTTGYPTQNYDPNSGFTGAAGSANPTDASAWALTPSPAHLDTLTNPPVQVPDQWLGQKDEIWVRAGTMSSSRLTQDYVSVPTASSFQGANAVSQMSETQQDAIQGSFLGIGGSYSWGASDGNLDELDMNGDGFPDVVGSNSIQYTNSVGTLDSTATNEVALNGNVRESHSIAWNVGAEGSPAKFTSDAKGNTNAPEQADPNSGTARKASSAESGTAETATTSAATRPQNAGGPGQDALIEAGGGSGGSAVQALTEGEAGALATRPGGSGNNGSAQAGSEGEVTTASSTSSALATRGGSAAGSEPDGDAPETESDGGQELNLGISGQYAQGETNQNGDHAVGGTLVNTDLIDINGDGLPDKVSTYSDGHMEVAFNLGYTFTVPVTWSNDAVTQRGTSQSFTVGGSIGFGDGLYGFGGGISGGQETDHDNGVLVDMNGDGLADYVTESNGNLMVAINTGDGFAAPVVWHGADSNIATSKSTTLGGGAYFTIGIGPLCFPTDLCYIITNPGFDYSRTNSRQELQLRDINGDGFPDDLSSTSNGSIDVAANNTGDTNLLKSVSRPLGASFTIEQTDTIAAPGTATQIQAATTRCWTYAYTGSQPNAVSHVAGTGTVAGQSNGKGSGNPPESSVTYNYDANGNETGWADDLSNQRRSIVWDEENRVQSINNSGQKTNFRYDDQGNRIVTAGPGGVTTNVTPYYTVVNGANAVKNIFAGTQRIAQQAVTTDGSYESGQYFYHQDLTGSTAYVTDVSGNLFQHLEYFPTGDTWVDEVSNPHVIPYLYSSHSFDSVTQLYYYGARYEDARLDQFISPDPALQSDPQAAIDDPMALNPYTYVDNNPVRYVDNNGEALTSAQEQFLRQAFANPRTRSAFLQASNKIITAYLSQQPAIVKLAASLPDKETLIAGYKKLATLSLPPLVEIGFKTDTIEVKIIGIKVPKSTARHY